MRTPAGSKLSPDCSRTMPHATRTKQLLLHAKYESNRELGRERRVERSKAARGHSCVVRASWLVSHSVCFKMDICSTPLHPAAPSRPAIPSTKTTTNRMETDKLFFGTGCPGKKKCSR